METKKHFKMYKDGKKWVVAGISALAIATVGMTTTTYADSTTPASNDNGAKTANSDNNLQNKTVTLSATSAAPSVQSDESSNTVLQEKQNKVDDLKQKIESAKNDVDLISSHVQDDKEYYNNQLEHYKDDKNVIKNDIAGAKKYVKDTQDNFNEAKGVLDDYNTKKPFYEQAIEHNKELDQKFDAMEKQNVQTYNIEHKWENEYKTPSLNDYSNFAKNADLPKIHISAEPVKPGSEDRPAMISRENQLPVELLHPIFTKEDEAFEGNYPSYAYFAPLDADRYDDDRGINPHFKDTQKVDDEAYGVTHMPGLHDIYNYDPSDPSKPYNMKDAFYWDNTSEYIAPNSELTQKQQNELGEYALTLINDFRKQNGLAPVIMSDNTQKLGQVLAGLRMQQKTGHLTHSDYVKWDDADFTNQIPDENNRLFRMIGENIATTGPGTSSNFGFSMLNAKVSILQALTVMAYRDGSIGWGHRDNMLLDGTKFPGDGNVYLSFNLQKNTDKDYKPNNDDNNYTLLFDFWVVPNSDAAFYKDNAYQNMKDSGFDRVDPNNPEMKAKYDYIMNHLYDDSGFAKENELEALEQKEYIRIPNPDFPAGIESVQDALMFLEENKKEYEEEHGMSLPDLIQKYKKDIANAQDYYDSTVADSDKKLAKMDKELNAAKSDYDTDNADLIKKSNVLKDLENQLDVASKDLNDYKNGLNKAAQPVVPVTPEAPKSDATSSAASKPATPSTPVTPVTPAAPKSDATSSSAATKPAEKPAEPSAPVTPSQTETPNTSAKTDNSGKDNQDVDWNWLKEIGNLDNDPNFWKLPDYYYSILYRDATQPSADILVGTDRMEGKKDHPRTLKLDVPKGWKLVDPSKLVRTYDFKENHDTDSVYETILVVPDTFKGVVYPKLIEDPDRLYDLGEVDDYYNSIHSINPANPIKNNTDTTSSEQPSTPAAPKSDAASSAATTKPAEKPVVPNTPNTSVKPNTDNKSNDTTNTNKPSEVVPSTPAKPVVPVTPEAPKSDTASSAASKPAEPNKVTPIAPTNNTDKHENSDAKTPVLPSGEVSNNDVISNNAEVQGHEGNVVKPDVKNSEVVSDNPEAVISETNEHNAFGTQKAITPNEVAYQAMMNNSEAGTESYQAKHIENDGQMITENNNDSSARHMASNTTDKANEQKLPQTNENDSNTVVMLGVSGAIASLGTFIGLRRKKRN